MTTLIHAASGTPPTQAGCRRRLVRWDIWDEDLDDGFWTDLGPCAALPVAAHVTVGCAMCGGRQDGLWCRPCLDTVVAEYTNPDSGLLWCQACREFSATITVNGKEPRR